MHRLLLSFLISALLIGGYACSFKTVSFVPAPPSGEVFKTKYIIVCVIDGPRYTETFGDPDLTLIPHMGRELVKEGVLFTNFRNEGSTTTTAGHTAMTTGFYQSITNGGKELPKKPNMFQYYLREKELDKSKVWLISSKGKLEVLANTQNKHWWNMYMPSTYCGPLGHSSSYGSDVATVEKVKQVITENHPKLMLINLLEVDTYGHSNNWEGYKRGIANCDQHVYDIWNYIQSDPEMKDQTALFITNDHGRHKDGHKDGFVNHGDGCEGCRHISLLAMGPDFRKGVTITTKAEQIDIPATIAHMFNFNMPTGKGRFLNELFDR